MKALSSSGQRQTVQRTALLAILALAFLLRLWQIDKEPLWLDEAYSVHLGSLALPPFWQRITLTDQHPPLYYALLSAWMRFGASEFQVRLLSAFFSCLTVALTARLAHRWSGQPAAGLAALLLALSPYSIRYAQEARMYALLTMCVVICVLGLSNWLVQENGLTSTRSGLLLYVAGMAGALWSHNMANLVWATICLWGLLGGWRRLLPRQRPFWLAQLAVFLLWLPWLPFFVQQSLAVDRRFWIPAPTWDAVSNGLGMLALAYQPGALLWLIPVGALYIAALGSGLKALYSHRAQFWLVAALLGLPLAVQLLVSVRRPLFGERTLLWLTPLLLILVAGGIAAWQKAPRANRKDDPARNSWHPPVPRLAVQLQNLLPAATVFALITASLLGATHYYRYVTREGWRDAAAYVAGLAQSGDLVLLHTPWIKLPFAYYFDRAAQETGLTHVTLAGTPRPLFDRNELEPPVLPEDLAKLEEQIRGAQRVWLVYSHAWYSDPERQVPAALAAHLSPGIKQQFDFDIEIQLFEAQK